MQHFKRSRSNQINICPRGLIPIKKERNGILSEKMSKIIVIVIISVIICFAFACNTNFRKCISRTFSHKSFFWNYKKSSMVHTPLMSFGIPGRKFLQKMGIQIENYRSNELKALMSWNSLNSLTLPENQNNQTH